MVSMKIIKLLPRYVWDDTSLRMAPAAFPITFHTRTGMCVRARAHTGCFCVCLFSTFPYIREEMSAVSESTFTKTLPPCCRRNMPGRFLIRAGATDHKVQSVTIDAAPEVWAKPVLPLAALPCASQEHQRQPQIGTICLCAVPQKKSFEPNAGLTMV